MTEPTTTADTTDTPRTVRARQAVVMVVVALAVAALGSTDRLVDIAERRELGDDRDRWVARAERLDDGAARIGADRPAAWIGQLVHDDRSVAELRLGDLAVTTPPSTTPPTTAAPTTTADPDRTGTDDDAPPADETTTTTVATTTTTVATTTTMRSPDAAAPLRIWVGGDSLGEYVGSAFLGTYAGDDDVSLVLDHHIATGLARPDYFDWPGRLSEAMADPTSRPEAIVFMIGGNDDQAMRGTIDGTDDDARALQVGSDEWFSEYRHRVATIMDVVAYDGVHLYWLRLPPMEDPERHRIARGINEAIDAEAAVRSWVSAVDLDPLLAGDDGGYDTRRPDPETGEIRTVRQSDGIHVNRRGSRWIAEIVIDALEARWRRAPATDDG